ncbi:MAG: PilW family protein [Arenimonas sp.]
MKMHKSTSGFSLIELLIAVALGIVVVGATLGIFISNRQTYITAENVGRVQENARTAFELMTRDVREAGGTPCAKQLLIANMLNTPGTNWWDNWTTPVFGYESGAMPGTNDVAGTDAIEIKSGSASVYTVASYASPTFTLNTPPTAIAVGDVLVACDFRQAAIFSATTVAGSTIGHAASAGVGGNCGVGLGFRVPRTCTTAYTYPANSLLTKLNATRWYIRVNGRPNGSRSLYRDVLRSNATVTEEVADGVSDMQIQYLLPGATDYVDASAINAVRWPDVNSVRINFTLEGPDRIGTDGQTIKRTMAHTVTLRNRNS